MLVQECSRKSYSSVLNGLLTSGITVFIVGYTLASQIPLNELVGQIETAIKEIAQKYPRASISISGHSAGLSLLFLKRLLIFNSRKPLGRKSSRKPFNSTVDQVSYVHLWSL
jgi:acetyl esterase/lipase